MILSYIMALCIFCQASVAAESIFYCKKYGCIHPTFHVLNVQGFYTEHNNK